MWGIIWQKVWFVFKVDTVSFLEINDGMQDFFWNLKLFFYRNFSLRWKAIGFSRRDFSKELCRLRCSQVRFCHIPFYNSDINTKINFWSLFKILKKLILYRFHFSYTLSNYVRKYSVIGNIMYGLQCPYRKLKKNLNMFELNMWYNVQIIIIFLFFF